MNTFDNEDDYSSVNFPSQMISYSGKTKKWRKQHLLWARNKTFFNYSLVRKSVMHKKVNYDLVHGRVQWLT